MSQPLTTPPLVRKLPSVTLKMIGGTLLVAGVGMFASFLLELGMEGDQFDELGLSAMVVIVVGGALMVLTTIPRKLTRGSVFFAVTASWVAFAFVATIPYMITGTFERFDNALFESVSGFTTTGATLLTGLDELDNGVLLWRSLTQWFGGIGVIVVLVSIVPVFGVGGHSLLQAEAPGPESERLVPRIRETAQRLVVVYLCLTALMFVLYLVFGMSLFDAVNHAFTTASTGGFSTHDASFAFYGSEALESCAIVGMFLAGGSFILYYRLATGHPQPLFRSTEFRAYVAVLVVASALVFLWNLAPSGARSNFADEIFTVVSIVSTTGYGVTDYSTWAGGAQALLLLLMPLGAMAGSTAGGFKLIRLMAVIGVTNREIIRQVHPRIVRVVRVNDRVVDEDVLRRIVGFFMIYALMWAGGFVVVEASGTTVEVAISTVASSLGNVGPALGEASDGVYNVVPWPGRILLMCFMLLGRLEVFPPLVAAWAVYDSVRRRKFRRQYRLQMQKLRGRRRAADRTQV